MVFMYQGQSLSGGGSGADENVTQTASDSSKANYEMLFSGTADNTTRTEGARKSQYFKFNPLLRSLTVGTRDTSHNDYSGSVVLGDNCAAHSYAMAQGLSNIAAGESSHAEGVFAYAHGEGSHAEGRGTRAQADYQHVEGKYNLYDFDNDYAHIIGNGYYDENNDREMRSNAFGVRWNGQLDVYNDIVRHDTNGSWDGTHASLEDSFGALTSNLTNISTRIGSCGMIAYSNTITIAANSSKEFDISSLVPSGATLHAISNVSLGAYALPYVENGVVKTYVYAFNAVSKKFTIQNNASAWTNYVIRFVIFYTTS